MLERNGFGHDVEGALDEETRENYLRMEEYAYRVKAYFSARIAKGDKLVIDVSKVMPDPGW
jgi:hypothetical protein